MGLMDLFQQGDMREKLYSAASRNKVPQGGVTGAMFKGMFPHGAGNVLFGREPEPMPPLESPEGTAFMADLASNMMVPGTFIGVGGMMKQMGRDKAGSLLAKADSALKGGASKENVFKDLGVFRGPEGKWRYELDDSASQFLASEGGSGVLSDFLSHSDVYSAYPDVQRIKTMFEPSSAGGAYNWTQDSMDIGGGSPHSIALHELQHAVQGREGFARGGSPEAMAAAGMGGKMPAEFKTKSGGTVKVSGGSAYFVRADGSFQPITHDTASRIWQEEGGPTAIDQYLDLAGEAESRAVQDRMGMNMQQRRASFPEYAGRNDLIIRGLMSGGGK